MENHDEVDKIVRLLEPIEEEALPDKKSCEDALEEKVLKEVQVHRNNICHWNLLMSSFLTTEGKCILVDLVFQNKSFFSYLFLA